MHFRTSLCVFVPALITLAACVSASETATDAPGVTTSGLAPANDSSDLAPNGKGFIVRNAAAGGGHQTAISYHGGPVMLGTPSLYYIWYGGWSGDTATTILTSFAQNLGGSPYEHINSTYYDGTGAHVTGALAYGGSTTDAYSHGTSLSDADIEAIVTGAIGAGKLPLDGNGVYLVLTSADVAETSGFCTSYCGWHTHATISGTDVKYGFVGNPDRCPSACEAQTTGPNGNAGADGMASIIAHESEEAITDPDLNAWYDKRGNENADKCAWKFGTTATASNGALYNVTLGGANYLIQENWVNAGSGYCAMSY